MSRIPIRSLVPVIAAAMALSLILVPFAAPPVAARDGDEFIRVVNRYRADRGLSAVSNHTKLNEIAVDRAWELAADRELGHDFDALIARLADDGVCWQQLGEIVAYNFASSSTRIEKFVDQWYHSDTHRAIMLGSGYTHAAGSWKTGSDGAHYGVMVFVKLCGASAPPPTYGGFTDITNSKFRSDIVWLAEQDITTGCAAHRFCPKGTVLRDQMATFLTRALDLAAASKDYFRDDGSNKHEDRINSIARARVTHGCDTARYCPGGKVTRAQMASFLARALDLPPASRDYFRDDDWSKHEDAINRMAAAGITHGCDSGRFCPNGIVLRDQMAAFLHRAFDD